MIDVHCHHFPEGSFNADFNAQAQRAKGGQTVDLLTDEKKYWAASAGLKKALVFGGKARLAGVWIDDREIAKYVSKYSEKTIGFLSVDPTQPGWEDELRHGHQELKLRGVKLLPMYAGFYPNDPKLDPFWQYVSKHNLPVLLHTGTTFIAQAPLDCTLPRHLDTVATKYPDVKMILAHLGHPYEGECIVTIRKHPNLYADISALCYRPWQLFHSLMLVKEYGVFSKVFFGTDFPFTTVEETLEGLEKLKKVNIGGFSLPPEGIDQIIHNDALKKLDLE